MEKMRPENIGTISPNFKMLVNYIDNFYKSGGEPESTVSFDGKNDQELIEIASKSTIQDCNLRQEYYYFLISSLRSRGLIDY
jgi:hypothetical protein